MAQHIIHRLSLQVDKNGTVRDKSGDLALLMNDFWRLKRGLISDLDIMPARSQENRSQTPEDVWHVMCIHDMAFIRRSLYRPERYRLLSPDL